MKKKQSNFILPLAILTALMAGTLVGCEKKEKLAAVDQTVQQAQLSEKITPEESYDEVFAATTGMLDETSYLKLTKTDGGYIFTIISGPAVVAKVVCEASTASISFGRCCRDYVIAHGCIIVRQNSSGWSGSSCP